MIWTHRLDLRVLVQIENACQLRKSKKEFYVVGGVQALLKFESPIEDFIDYSLGQIKHFIFFLVDQKVDIFSADLDALVKKVEPDVLWVYLLLPDFRVSVWIELLVVFLAAQQFGKGVLYED